MFRREEDIESTSQHIVLMASFAQNMGLEKRLGAMHRLESNLNFENNLSVKMQHMC